MVDVEATALIQRLLDEHPQLEAEVARLRERNAALVEMNATCIRDRDEATRAHEATKAELGWMQGEAQAEHNRAAAAEADSKALRDQLDRARGLLQTALVLSDARLNDGWEPACRAWLRANPAPKKADE